MQSVARSLRRVAIHVVEECRVGRLSRVLVLVRRSVIACALIINIIMW